MELLRVMVACGLCGQSSPQATAGSPAPKQAPDFDTRPGEPLRSTLPAWVQRCPHCGYCADKIETIHDNAVDFVRSDVYQQGLLKPNYPAKATEFLCYAAILGQVGQLADAGWSALHAAWVCDDATEDTEAIECRARALDYWMRGKQAGQSFGDDLPMEFALVTDLYRRMGQFEAAVVTCSDALDSEELPPMLEQLLRREKALIDRKDTACHSILEIL